MLCRHVLPIVTVGTVWNATVLALGQIVRPFRVPLGNVLLEVVVGLVTLRTVRTLACFDAVVAVFVSFQTVFGVECAQADVTLEGLFLLVIDFNVGVQGRGACVGRVWTQFALEGTISDVFYADVLLQ